MKAYTTDSRMPENVMTKDEVASLLERAPVGCLGLSVDDQPYVVPVNFVYSDGKLYFHSASTGQKIDFLNKNQKVCFEVDEVMEVKKTGESVCNYAQTFRSVIIYGQARFVNDNDEMRKMLKILVEKYAGEEVEYSEIKCGRDLAVVEVEIEHISGKERL